MRARGGKGGYTATKDQLRTRLKQTTGKSAASNGIVEDGRYCIDVLT